MLHGKSIDLKSEKYPKPGTLLCILLNEGFIEKLEKIKEEVVALKNPKKTQLRKYSFKTAKIMLDFDFGVAMSNRPFYIASRKQKIEYIKQAFPQHRRTITLEGIYYNGVVYQTDFPILIDTFLEKAEINYQKLLDVQKKLK